MSDRSEEARDAIERVLNEYQDVFAADFGEYVNQMPMLNSWVLLCTFDDAQDPTILSTYRMTTRNQATHVTVGMLILNADELRRPEWAE